MKKVLSGTCFVFFGVVLFATLYELFNFLVFPIMNNLSISFLINFVKGERYERTLYISMIKSFFLCCLDIIVIISNLTLLKFICNYQFFDIFFSRNKSIKDFNVIDSEATGDRISRFISRIITNKNWLLIFTSFFNLLLLTNSILIALIFFYPVLVLRLWLYKKCSIFTPLIIVGVCVYIMYKISGFYIQKDVDQINNPELIISEKFFQHIKELKIKHYLFLKVNTKNQVKVDILYSSNLVYFYFYGDYTIFSKDELTALLFRLVARYVFNNVIITRKFLYMFFFLMLGILLILLNFSKTIKMENLKKHEIYFLVECLFVAISYRIFFITYNTIIQNKELKCDEYSKQMINPKYQALGLAKQELYFVSRFVFSKF